MKIDNKREGSFTEYVEASLPTLESLAKEGDLGYTITPNELDKALQKYKNGKSAGPDLICNEMLKYGGESLHLAILALFNSILRDGKYPDKWKDSFITHIHKGSDIHKAENYRGVAVADCISKIFCSIMPGS